ncbi:MAG: BspA family leucine-rich repeat surface protein [Bacteroidales bacterium]
MSKIYTFVLFTLLVLGLSDSVHAQGVFAGPPDFEKFSSSSYPGIYYTDEDIYLEAKFTEWLGIGTYVKVRLNTGDTILMVYDPKKARDYLDSDWGIVGKRNATLAAGHNLEDSYGVYCVLELTGKGGYAENEGKFVIAGGFQNYEEIDGVSPTAWQGGHDNFVITDHDGQFLQGFGDYVQGNTSKRFNHEVRWVDETADGGLIAVGRFDNYSGNPYYDYIIKFKWDTTSKSFVVDTDFMNNLTKNNTVVTADAGIGLTVDGWGKPKRPVLVDPDDGSIIITGAFNTVGGETHRKLAKIDKDGNVIKEFNDGYIPANGVNIFGSRNGLTMTFDPAIPGKFWWGTSPGLNFYNTTDSKWYYAGSRVYIMDRTTGQPANDVNGDSSLDLYDYKHGPGNAEGATGIMGITPLPTQGVQDAGGLVSPGGVLVTGRGTPNYVKTYPESADLPVNIGWQCTGGGINAMRLNASTGRMENTPATDFKLGGLTSYGDANALGGFLNTWAIDGVAFLKGKMFIGLHEAFRPTTTNMDNYYEGGLLVLNYDGSFNTAFNHMLANKRENDVAYNLKRPDGDWSSDGVGGYGINQNVNGGTDIISLTVTSKQDFIVGGSFAAIMEYEDDGFAQSVNTSRTMTDDNIVIKMSFRRATAVYTPSADDMVDTLKMVELIDYDGEGAFGAELGKVELPTDSALLFENKTLFTINLPPLDQHFHTQWLITEPNTTITIPTEDTAKYDFYICWGDVGFENNYVRVGNNQKGLTYSHTYAKPGKYTVRIVPARDELPKSTLWPYGPQPDGIYETGFPRIDFSKADAVTQDRIVSVRQWGSPNWITMENAFIGCKNLDLIAKDTPDLDSVKTMKSMFDGCSSLVANEVIGEWNTSTVTDMSKLFKDAPEFKQDISEWDIKKLTNADSIFYGDSLPTPIYDNLLIGWEEQTENNLVKFHGGASRYCRAEPNRDQLILNGWGDGVLGGNALDHTDPTTGIVDGGPLTKVGKIEPSYIGFFPGENQYVIRLVDYEGKVLKWEYTSDPEFRTGITEVASTADTFLFKDLTEQVYIRAYVWDEECEPSYSEPCYARPCTDREPFIMKWTVPAGGTVNLFPNPDKFYTFSVSWGDGVAIDYKSPGLDVSHTFENAGTYQVKVLANIDLDGDGVLETGFPEFKIVDNATDGTATTNSQQLDSVTQWGTVLWESMERTFAGGSNLDIGTKDKPILDSVRSLEGMFEGCSTLKGDENMKTWDVDSVVNMSSMFEGASIFDLDISNWNVDSVKNMSSMFKDAIAFNQDLDNLDFSNVKDMSNMFNGATKFDQDIGKWEIASLENAEGMFENAKLSVPNYDSLLIGWNRQLEDGNAKTNVKFHGGASQYCVGADAHANLISNGWGDGSSGGDENNNAVGTDGIVDGGSLSAAIDRTVLFTKDSVLTCVGEGARIETNSSQVGITYTLWQINPDNSETKVDEAEGSGNPLDYELPASAYSALYYFKARNNLDEDGVCAEIEMDTILVRVFNPTKGGQLRSDKSGVCNNDAAKIKLSSYEGNVLRWEVAEDNPDTAPWIISEYSTQTDSLIARSLHNPGSTTKSFFYRVLVKNGVCEELYSDTVRIDVYPSPDGGEITPHMDTVCSGEEFTRTVVDYAGSIARWEYSNDGGSTWMEIENTTDNLTITSDMLINNTSEAITYMVRAVTTPGPDPDDNRCGVTYSELASVVVLPYSKAGTISASKELLCVGQTAVLSLSGSVGTIRWEKLVDANWKPATGSIDTAKFKIDTEDLKNSTNEQKEYEFRAIVQSGDCKADTTSTQVIKVDFEAIPGRIEASKTTVCSGKRVYLELKGFRGTIDWEMDLGSGWVDGPVGNTNVASTSPLENTGTTQKIYKFRVRVYNGVCSEKYSAPIEIAVDPETKGGQITASDYVICNGESVDFTITNNVGNIEYWELYLDKGYGMGWDWSKITSSEGKSRIQLTSDDLSAATEPIGDKTYKVRAKVSSGLCTDIVYSDTVDVKVMPNNVGGTASPFESSVCDGEDVVLSLNAHIGLVDRWEVYDNSLLKWKKVESSEGLTRITIPSTILVNKSTVTGDNERYTFRAVIGTGEGDCGEERSSTADVVVNPRTNAGIVKSPSASTVCNEGMDIAFFVEGHTGTVEKWQYKEFSTTYWTTVPRSEGKDTATVPAYILTNKLTETDKRVYYSVRAVVKSGECEALNTDEYIVGVWPSTKLGTASPMDTLICAGQPTSLRLTGSVGTVTWQKFNGTEWVSAAGTKDGSNLDIPADELANSGTAQQTYKYRAIVQSGGDGEGSCPADTTDELLVRVSPTTNSGLASTKSSIVCAGNTATLELTDYVGDIDKWIVSTDGGTSWETASPDGKGLENYITANLDNTSNASVEYQYKAIVKSGVCDADTSGVVAITIIPSGVAKNFYATISDGKPVRVYPLDSIHYRPLVELDSIRQPNHGGSAELDDKDSVLYTPLLGFVGKDSIKYYITANSSCVDSAWIIITTDCLPHKMADLAMEVCLSNEESYTINLLEYLPYAEIGAYKVLDAKGNLVDDPRVFSTDNLKKDNTTILNYYYEKPGFCTGSNLARIYVNAVSNGSTAVFESKTIRVCAESLKDGGYNINNLMPYVCQGGSWGDVSSPAGLSIDPDDFIVNGVFDANAFWVAAIGEDDTLDKVTITIPYVTGPDDQCAGAGKTANLTIEITKE